jgi:hypothetical protein
MPLYKLSYEFEPSGGNIAYQTTQQVEKEASATEADIDLVTTGLSLENNTTDGIAIVDVPDTVDPAATFEAATGVVRLKLAICQHEIPDSQTDNRLPIRAPPKISHGSNSETIWRPFLQTSVRHRGVAFSCLRICPAVGPSTVNCGWSG